MVPREGMTALHLSCGRAAKPLGGRTVRLHLRHGDRALFDKYKEGIKTSKERRDRIRLFRALGAFDDPAILDDAFAFVMSPEFDSREAGNIIYASLDTPEGRAATWKYLQANYDSTVARMPREVTGFVPYYASGFCDEKHREEVAEFFAGRAEKLPGGQRNLAKVLESMEAPLTLEFSRWHAGRGLFLAGFVVALAIWAFRVALGGQPLFAAARLDEA